MSMHSRAIKYLRRLLARDVNPISTRVLINSEIRRATILCRIYTPAC